MIASRAMAIDVASAGGVRMQRAARPLHRPAMPLARRRCSAAIAARAQVRTSRAAGRWLASDRHLRTQAHRQRARRRNHHAGALAGRPQAGPPQSIETDRARTAAAADGQESQVYRRTPHVQPQDRSARGRPRCERSVRAAASAELSAPRSDGEILPADGAASRMRPTATVAAARRSGRRQTAGFRRARRQAAALSDRRQRRPGPRRRSDDGELQHQFAGQARHQHRLLQSVRREQVRQVRPLSAQRRTPRSSTTKARSIRRAPAGRRICASSTSAAARPASNTSNSTIRTPTRSRT